MTFELITYVKFGKNRFTNYLFMVVQKYMLHVETVVYNNNSLHALPCSRDQNYLATFSESEEGYYS